LPKTPPGAKRRGKRRGKRRKKQRKGLEGRGAFPKGMERSGTPESPVSGAKGRKCAQIA
jgi:hypothetical protein